MIARRLRDNMTQPQDDAAREEILYQSPPLQLASNYMAHYRYTLDEARLIVQDRHAKGRNAKTGFYNGFPHGSKDISFELSRRVNRILGAEIVATNGAIASAREDALDLLNYAAFYVMMLDHEAHQVTGAVPGSP